MPFSATIKRLRTHNQLNQADLAERVGVSRQTVINWEKGNTKPEREEIIKLSKLFDINMDELLDEDEAKVIDINIGKVPFYDVYAVGGHAMLADQAAVAEPSEYVNPGDFLKTATGALRVYGHSAFPKYPAGSIVAFKTTTSQVIHYGEDYVIELEDRRIIKQVQPGRTKGHILVKSYNTQKDEDGGSVYPAYEIPVKEIKRMNMVLGKVELLASI